MVAIQHVFKRGSVYWWRRRLPVGTSACASVRIELSLHTKELELARTVAAEVTLASHRLLPSLKTDMISTEDAKKILVQVALQHSAHLDSNMALKQSADRDAAAGRQSDICNGWALRLYAAQGEKAEVGPTEQRELRAAGLDDEMLLNVGKILDFYKGSGFGRPGRKVIESILEQHGIPPVDVHIRQAEALYIRGMSAALLNTERRWSGTRPDDLAMLQAALTEVRSVPALSLPMAIKPDQAVDRVLNTPAFVRPSPHTAVAPPPADDLELELAHEDDIDDEELDTDEPGLVALVARSSAERVASKDWDIKTGRQHIALAKLFIKFVGHDNPRKMRQAHIANFKSIFYKMPKNYGKSPKDFQISIADILKRAEGLPAKDRGFATSTINRHMTQMGNIVGICKHAGYPFGNYEGVSGLRSRKKGDARDERGKFSTDEVRTIFTLPLWNGSASEGDRFNAGTLVVHDAAYWVPMIGAFAGARREEICGLLLNEVELDGEFDLPCFRIQSNVVRGLKNPQSKRRVPIHPELLRLGFADYVKELRRLGHTMLFPELRAVAEDTPMGDVFDDSWQAIRSAALPHAKEEGKVFHSLRHWCNNEMKQVGVAAELRKDILGHSNGDMNEGRYAEIARLRLMARGLSHLPHPTSHLSPHPICVLKSVAAHEARPSRKKREG